MTHTQDVPLKRDFKVFTSDVCHVAMSTQPRLTVLRRQRTNQDATAAAIWESDMDLFCGPRSVVPSNLCAHSGSALYFIQREPSNAVEILLCAHSALMCPLVQFDNAAVWSKMAVADCTLAVCQLEISTSKEDAPLNIDVMTVTCDVFPACALFQPTFVFHS